MHRLSTRRILLSFATLVAAGCSKAPHQAAKLIVDGSDAARRAMTLYDANADGLLSMEECKSSPGLTSAHETFDANADGQLSKEEIQQGIDDWSAYPYPILVEVCVTMDRRYIPNAVVRLTPDEFLADLLPGSEGTTNFEGIAPLKACNHEFPPTHLGNYMYAGLYSIEVSGPSLPAISGTGVAVKRAQAGGRAIQVQLARQGASYVISKVEVP